MSLPVSRSSFPTGRWRDPFREMEDMYGRMGRLVQDMFDGFSRSAPLADLEETDDSYIVEMDLPGVDPADITVELRDRDLCVSGQFTERERGGVMRRHSRRTGEFDQRIGLPGTVNGDTVTAKLDNGVLTITLPKSATTKSREITVSS